MNKQQVVEILVKWFSFILDDYSGKELYDNVADEIMALHNNEDRCDKCGATCQYCNCNEPWFMKGIK